MPNGAVRRDPFWNTKMAGKAEEPIFIRRRISHYNAMAKLDLDEENRATIRRLLAKAERKLEVATAADAESFPVVCVGG